jgi:hypothetical protein
MVLLRILKMTHLGMGGAVLVFRFKRERNQLREVFIA